MSLLYDVIQGFGNTPAVARRQPGIPLIKRLGRPPARHAGSGCPLTARLQTCRCLLAILRVAGRRQFLAGHRLLLEEFSTELGDLLRPPLSVIGSPVFGPPHLGRRTVLNSCLCQYRSPAQLEFLPPWLEELRAQVCSALGALESRSRIDAPLTRLAQLRDDLRGRNVPDQGMPGRAVVPDCDTRYNRRERQFRTGDGGFLSEHGGRV